jgi:hypothetical protein
MSDASMTRAKALLLAAALAMTGCSTGTEIGRITLHDAGSGDAVISLSASQSITLWTQLDIQFSGHFGALYTITLLDDSGVTVGDVTCSPLDVGLRLNSYISNVSDPKSYRYQGEMNGCSLAATAAGDYTVHVDLTIPTRPTDLTINDISLVIKD